jgi:uncharacterized protein YndB with AHSA1/START domain
LQIATGFEQIEEPTMTTVQHAAFVIERVFDAPPEAVFDAFADDGARRRWFTTSNNWPIQDYQYDFRVGGTEHGRFSPDGKTIILNDAVYQDIVPGKRIVSAYTMTVNGRRISASLATTEFLAENGKTRMIYTEQGAYLDDLDQARGREQGCAALFDSLGRELERRKAA